MNIGDKFVANENISNCFVCRFFDEGDTVKVKNIADNDLIVFERSDDYSQVTCTMDINTFNEYFNKVNNIDIKTLYNDVVEIVDRIMEQSEFETHTMFDSVTVVSCRLPNGFVVVADDSGTAQYGDYDSDLAKDVCFDKIANKIWELESYKLYGDNNLKSNHFDAKDKNLNCKCDICCEDCYCDNDNDDNKYDFH